MIPLSLRLDLPVREPRARALLALVLHQARYDARAFLRNKQGRYFTFALPLLLLVVFCGVFGSRMVGPHDVKSSTYYAPGLAALAVVAASFVNLVISITVQRESGVLKRRRATPVPASVLVAGRTLTAMASSLAAVTMLLAVGDLVFGVHVSVERIPAIVATAMLGSAAFSALAYALSTQIHSADAAQPIVQAIAVPLYFISGVFVPVVNLPDSLRTVAAIFPVEHLADGLHHPFEPGVAGSGVVWSDLAVLALWAAGGLVLALRRFTWTPSLTT
jgi:ABC-2 type transport system permease protein